MARESGHQRAYCTTLRVGAERHYIPKIGAEVDCVAFTYYRDGQLINIKYRALGTNASAQVEGAEQILFGLDEIVYDDRVVIVGDECDALALEESRICNVVSVPDGALDTVKEGDPDPDDPKLAFLRNCADQLARLKRIIIAVNADGPGQALAEELARRLGRGRCSRVIWPKGCNGANDVLLQHGPEVLRNCVSRATSYPVPGLHHIDEFADVVLALYRQGRSRGLSTGWASLDEFVTVRAGELSLVTGIPNSGKSEFIDALMVNLAVAYGWRFAVCSFENPVPEHASKLAEKYLGAPFWDGPTRRMSEADLLRATNWIWQHFRFLRFPNGVPRIEAILEEAREAVLRYGIRGLVIDPYNEIEYHRPANMTETEYVSSMLGQVKRFAQSCGVHVWFVAHPRIMRRDKPDAPIPVPTLYDISGSANWANKADIGIVVHRVPDEDPTRADIYVRKMRFKSVGRVGGVSLQWDKTTGRYFEINGETQVRREFEL